MTVYLEIERLILRRFTEGDADHLCQLDADPLVMRYINFGVPTPREEIVDVVLPKLLAFYDRFENLGFWAVVERASDEFIGWFHFRPVDGRPDEAELGYRLKRTAWGKGYATEGSRALIHKGFDELGIRRVIAFAMADNEASIRVMRKLGMSLERRWPDEELGGQEVVCYAIDGGSKDE